MTEGSMDLAQRLNQLESVRDWQGLAEELEKGISSSQDAATKAAYHLRLGHVLEQKFLQGARALKHFQDAYKLNPTLIEALESARSIYWDLGKTNMVQKLLELELKSVQEGPVATALLVELGDVLSDQGDYERAMATYARALGASGGQSDEARGCLEDIQLDAASAGPHIEALTQACASTEDASARARLYMRAARIAKRFATGQVEALLARAYEADPLDKQASAMFEGLLLEDERTGAIREAQRRVLAGLAGLRRAQAAFAYGLRWATRHQNAELGAELMQETLEHDPSNEAAFSYLRELWGTREGNWDRVVAMAERAASSNGGSPYLVAQAGTLAWRQLGNLIRARAWFERLAEIAPEHPSLQAFEAQIGQPLRGASAGAAPVDGHTAPLGDAVVHGHDAIASGATSDGGALVADEAVDDAGPTDGAAGTEVDLAGDAPAAPPVAAAPPAAEPVAAPAEPVPVAAAPAAAAPVMAPAPAAAAPAPRADEPPADPARIAELTAKGEKQLQAKRFNEYVKTLVELAEAETEPASKIDYYTQAAELFISKFSNTAEAVKCYEAILAIDPDNAAAVDFLRQSYEKRRDWDKLIGLLKREAQGMPAGAARGDKFLEIAKLATERVKKPEVCIELWDEVLANDPENDEALTALAGLHERAKDWRALAGVLEKQADATIDDANKQALLAKLGQLYGDRLEDDEAAVEAWRKLLALNPQERRAQEALKKKYLTLGRWDDLEVFYAESGKWDEFIRLLETQEAKEKDDSAKIGLLVKTAQLWITQKGKLDRAARAYERVLSIDPGHLGAAEALIPIYTNAGNAKGLASVMEVKLQHDQDDASKLELYRELAALYEAKLKEPERAFERYLTAFTLAPSDEQSAQDVERSAGATGSWEALVAAYRASITRAEGDGDRVLGVELRLRLGRVLLEELGRTADALEQFGAVYEIDPDNEATMGALERLYRETGRFEELLHIYEKKQELAGDADEKKRLLYAIAELHEKEIKDPARATATYQKVLEYDPMDVGALRALDRLYLEAAAWEPYADVLRRRLELDVTDVEIVDLKLRLGGALEKHLGDPSGALESYREVLLVDPTNDAARVALEVMLEHPELKAQAAAILQEIYEGRGDAARLLGALEILAEAETETADRVALLRKIARVAAGSLDDVGRAFDAQARALKDEPSNADALAELEALAAQAGAWDKLDAILSAIAEKLEDATLARAYWMRLSAIDERLGKVDEAANGYLHVLSIDPADGEALAAMEALYRRTERWEDLVSMFRRRIELAAEAGEREALYGQMASVFEEKLGRPDEAIGAYQEVLGSDPESRAALEALDGLFSRQGLWEELADNLEAQLRLAATEDEQTRLMLRLAALREQRMNMVELAIETYRQVLERDAANPEALAALERLGKRSEHELAIAEILEPLYRQSGDYQRLIGVHEVQIRRTEDVARRVELLHEIATLYEDAGGDLGAAFDTYARALALEPASVATQSGLDRLARATGRFADLAHVFESLAGSQEDAEIACELYTTAARVHEADLGDLDSAVRHYRRVLEIDARSFGAIDALERIFRGAERYQELSKVLQQKAAVLDDVVEKKQALLQAASIEEDVLERPESAIAVYQLILDLDAEDLRAIDALIKLYLDLRWHHDLLAMFTRKVELVSDPDEKKGIYYEIGAVYERELGDVPSSIDTYQRVLELDPSDVAALGRLDVLYQASGAWAELLGVLGQEAELATDPVEALSYEYRIADLYEKRLDDLPRAIELYRDLLQRMPDHPPTLAALEGIKNGTREPLAAALVLEPIYEATGDWDRLVSVLEVEARATEDVYAKVDLYHRIARLHEEMRAAPEAAFETYARAVALDNASEESLGNLERLGMQVGRWREVAALYDAELKNLAGDPARYVELGLRLAQIFETQLEDVDSAVARYRAVLEVDAENVAALASLDRLFSTTERWGDLVQVLAREAEIAASQDDVLEAKFRLGQVYQDRLGDLDQAIGAYREVLAASPDHLPTLQALESLFASGVKELEIGEILAPLYQAVGEWEKLASVLEAELGHLTEPADRIVMLHRLAELHEERLLSPESALAVNVRALKEQPADDRTLDEVERLSSLAPSGWEELANAYADVLGLHELPAVQTSIGRRLARVFEEELADVAKAEETYRYVLGVDPLDVESLANLDRIYSAGEQYAELAQVLEQRARATSEPLELVELHARLGEIYEERLGQPDLAIAAFRRIFDELDPANETAIHALERLYPRKGAWRELREVLARELEHAGGETQEADVRAKLARLLSDQLGDVTQAIDTWKRVLDLRGEDPEALSALADLYERTEQWAELCDVLERHYDIAADDESRVAVLLRRAELWDKRLGREDSALDDYNRVLDIDYANLTALYALADIFRRRGDANELVSALHQTVDRAAAALPAENLVAIFRELGAAYQHVLAQPFDAIDAYRKLLEIDPRELEAMAALENLLRAEERWAEVVDVKMARATALETPEEQIREYLEVAAIWEERVGEKDRATAAFDKILAIDSTNDAAFQALEQLHATAGRAEPLIELYLARLDTREAVKEKTVLLRKVAKAFEEQLEDKQQAFDALLTAFELDFNDQDTTRYLERMAQATNRWGELVQTVNGWLKQQTGAAGKISLSLRLAKWYAEDLGRPDYAQPYYQQVLSLDPNNVAVLRQMASFFKKNGQFQQQGATLTNALNVAVTDTDRKEILTELGEVLERRMGEVDQGLAYYQRALDIDAHHVPALEALERIYGERNDTQQLAGVLVRKAKGVIEPAEVASVKLRTAGLYETSLGQSDKAGQIYREVLELDASNVLAMRGLERVYTATGQWLDLVGVLEMQLDVVTTERERIDVLMKVARIQEEQFLKADVAAQRYEQVVEIDPSHEPALEGLERCYRRLRQWLDLVGAHDRHINATLDRQTKVGLWAAIAKTYAEEIQDVDRAIDAYLNIVDIDDTYVPALEALSKLYEKQDEAVKAIEYMTRVADLTADGKQRVEMYYRIGRQLDERLGDRLQAQERYEMALDLDPTHTATLAALRVIAIDSADWDRAARYLEQEQMYTEAPRARGRLLVELGKLRGEMLGEHELAVQAYELALQSDADNEDAAMPLLDEHVARGDYARAEPLAEMLARKSGKRDRSEQHRLQKTLGKVLFALGKKEGALKAYMTAHQLDLTDQETIHGLADVSFALNDWPTALTNYQKMLTIFGEEQSEERAAIYFRLGSIKQGQGQQKQAINHFERALAIDPGHRPTLDALVQLYESVRDYKQVCHYKRQVLDAVFDAAERFRLLNELADLWTEKENNAAKAIEALEEALELEPQNHVLLHKLLQLYQKTSQWSQMVDAVQRIADMETQPERKSRYLYTMAQLYRDKLDDQTRAVELFNETLDINPSFLEAFERINKILTAHKEWKQLERAYRRMLHRVAGRGNADLEFNLWHALGLIYRDRLHDTSAAVETFQIASKLKPDNVTEHMILAELYEGTEQAEPAIAEYQAMLRLDPMKIEPYRRLYALYLGQKAYDEAWCIAATLTFLRKADEEEQKFYEDYKPHGMPQVKSRLDNEQWLRNLFHEDENLYIGKIFDMIAKAALRAKMKQLADKKELPVLDARLRQDPATSTVTFARTFGWAAQVLGIGCPQLYVRSDVPGALVAVAAEPPASVAGQTVLTGFTPQELTFIVGKHLAMYRGEHYIKTLFPTQTELTVLFFAGIRLVEPSIAVPADIEKPVTLQAPILRSYMEAVHLEGLRLVVRKFVTDGQAKANLKRWVQTVELTACRAGLLLSGDLEIAKKIIAAEPQQPGDLPPQEKLKELILFSVSEQYVALRKALGIAVGSAAS
jgi:tetratricopeptide (TPR) repeat protein